MPYVITFAHQKGGVGKTTLALNLYACFRDHLPTRLIDVDPQGSLKAIGEMEGNGIDVETLPHEPKELLNGPAQLIIIDTPPYLSSHLPQLFALSHLVVIPTRAGFLDAMAARATLRIVHQAQEHNPALKAAMVLNMTKSRTSLTREIRQLLDQYQVNILPMAITDRVSFTRSALTGSVFQTTDTKAQDEIIALSETLLELMGV